MPDIKILLSLSLRCFFSLSFCAQINLIKSEFIEVKNGEALNGSESPEKLKMQMNLLSPCGELYVHIAFGFSLSLQLSSQLLFALNLNEKRRSSVLRGSVEQPPLFTPPRTASRSALLLPWHPLACFRRGRRRPSGARCHCCRWIVPPRIFKYIVCHNVFA